MKRWTYAPMAAAILAVAWPAAAADLGLTWDRFYDGPAVEETVKKLNESYPDLTELRSIGQSEEGREIYMLMINNAATGPDTTKPGVYVDGAIHGNEIQAAEVCLYLAWYLLDGYDRLDAITELVDTRAFYIVPVVNVDGRWRFFSDAGGYGIGRTARVPYDDDGDGLKDEDDYDDLDGDGEILQMRVADPFGDWKSHPDDPRAMIRVEDHEQGQWRMLGREGIDNDGDGRLNEDTPGYLDMNRNYGFKWQPRYVQGGAGDFPMSSKPTEAVANFITSKPNIVFNFAFHNMGGMFLRGPGSKLAGRYPHADLNVYDFLGGEAEKIVPGYRYLISSEDLYTTHGDFDEWMYSNLGILGFVGELFMSSQEQYRPRDQKPDEDESPWRGADPEEKQKFSDILSQGEMFKDWTEFDHPQFGKIEIGGWRTFTTRIPATFLMPEMVHRNAAAVIFTATHAPEVALEVIDVEPIGNGLKRVRVRASNMHAIPTITARALQKKMFRKDILRLEGRGIEVISGGIVENLELDRVDAVAYRPHMVFTSVPSFGKRDVQWIVRGSGKATVRFESVKASNQSLEFEL